jgi:hypothetical protein
MKIITKTSTKLLKQPMLKLNLYIKWLRALSQLYHLLVVPEGRTVNRRNMSYRARIVEVSKMGYLGRIIKFAKIVSKIFLRVAFSHKIKRARLKKLKDPLLQMAKKAPAQMLKRRNSKNIW